MHLWPRKIRSTLEIRCVFSESFLTVKNNKNEPIIYNGKDPEPGLSSLKIYADNGHWASKVRIENSKKDIVETITLNDLLDFYNAPKEINYLSIDSEGSEFDILKNFDFSKRKINIISVEHNYHQKYFQLVRIYLYCLFLYHQLL